MKQKFVPTYEGELRKHALQIPRCISECSGIRVFGRRIKSLVFSTDVAIIKNINADAVIAVYNFTPQPSITQAIISVSDVPVFAGVGGGYTNGQRSVNMAAAAEQLGVWCQRAGVDMIRQNAGADPAAVVYDAINAVRSRGADVLLIDTAGRLQNKKNLMDELAKINRVVLRELPDADRETLLVLDAATGQNAISQAKEFRNAADITGLVLTKLDGSAKGGAVLSIKKELDIPVKFIGIGEQIDDMKPFQPEEFISALFVGSQTVEEQE